MGYPLFYQLFSPIFRPLDRNRSNRVGFWDQLERNRHVTIAWGEVLVDYVKLNCYFTIYSSLFINTIWLFKEVGRLINLAFTLSIVNYLLQQDG